MHELPRTNGSPFVRTDFSSGHAWADLCTAIGEKSQEGFLADISIIDDIIFSGASANELAASVRKDIHGILFIADNLTMMNNELPILCVDLLREEQSIRLVPAQLWCVENNLSLRNMDLSEFEYAMDPDQIFRGFA